MSGAGAGAAVPADVLAARARGEILVGEEAVSAALDRLSVHLTLRLEDANPLLLTVMNGGLPFAGSLLGRLAFPLEIGYVHVGRYRDALRGGELVWHAEPGHELTDRTVVFLDDVLDEGKTLAALTAWAIEGGAREALTCVLVDKDIGRSRPLTADFVALTCPDRYLFGCGMDYRGYWRNLPAIYALPEALERAG